MRDVDRLLVCSRAAWTSSPEKPGFKSFARFCMGCLVLRLGFNLWSDQWFSPFLQTVSWEAHLGP